MSPRLKADLQIQVIAHGSALYRAEVELRDRILRKPLGISFTEEDLRAEDANTHIAAVIDGKLVGCVMLVPGADEGVVVLRQMVVDPDFQKHHIGAKLLQAFEREARARGAHKIILHARETALGFYKKAGYSIFGAPGLFITIPHREMEKSLT